MESRNLNVFSQCLTGPVVYPFASRHNGPGFKIPGGDLCETCSLATELYIRFVSINLEIQFRKVYSFLLPINLKLVKIAFKMYS